MRSRNPTWAKSLRASPLILVLALIGFASQSAKSPPHLFVHVRLATNFPKTFSGRLLLFVAKGTGATEVDTSPFAPKAVYVAARDVASISPGEMLDLDADDISFPQPFSNLERGDYQAQAVLDVGHAYNYLGRAPGDLMSPVTPLKNWNPSDGTGFEITLDSVVPQRPRPEPKGQADEVAGFKNSLKELNYQSAALTSFWGRATMMRGWIVLPPSYSEATAGRDPAPPIERGTSADLGAGRESVALRSSSRDPKQRFPTVYFTHGFGGNAERILPQAWQFYRRMAEKKMPEMIWVLLDESSPTGTHEFADSVNNGPWGTALTSELIPFLEQQYHMDGSARGRFLQGHSSGGWATLWLQVTYPKIFGGAWSTSPDPSDFHDFTGPDLYAPGANVYHKADGAPWPIVRNKGKVLANLEDFVRLEDVIGDPGGQMASFDWVFSPRGRDGTPMRMFNHGTGDVNPEVVAYWRAHYDIAYHVATNWKTLAPDLRGKIHLFVGTADTFYLDGAAHKLQAVLDGLHADAHFTFIPDRTHFDLYQVNGDRFALFDQIAEEMYEVARRKSFSTGSK